MYDDDPGRALAVFRGYVATTPHLTPHAMFLDRHNGQFLGPNPPPTISSPTPIPIPTPAPPLRPIVNIPSQ